MTNPPSFSERLRRVFEPSPSGVVGLVEKLLDLCRDHQLRLDYQDDRCKVRPLGAVASEAIDVPLPRSVFRAALARIAALCNERNADAVTPYQGVGELAPPNHSQSEFRVAFTNTPGELWLEVRSVPSVAVASVE